MPSIKKSLKEVASRGKDIRKILKLLSPNDTNGPAWKPKSSSYSYIIGTHDGSPPTSDHRDWRFRTFVPKVYGSYFERWIKVDNDFLCLEKAYLSIFQTDLTTRIEKEYICLHCDPNESDDNPHAIYKRGPHLHVIAACDPIPHAHIPLNMIHRQEVLSSLESLTEAIEAAVVMLKDEILDPLLGNISRNSIQVK